MRRLSPLRAAALSCLASIGLVACIPEQARPADCDQASVTRLAALVGDRLEPENLDVCRDQRVTIELDIQRDGVLHLHGYDDQGAAIQVRAGEPATLAFVAVHSGQFVMELHPADSPDGIGAGILTVHEP